MLSELSVTDDLLLQIESNLNNTDNVQKIKLEPLAEILTSLTIPQLTALGKLATKSIRKVNLEAVNCIDIAQNPFFYLAKELEVSLDLEKLPDKSEVPGLLLDLLKSSKSIASKFSEQYIAHMEANQKKFKNHLSRRNHVNKILQRVEGMLNLDESDYVNGDESQKKGS